MGHSKNRESSTSPQVGGGFVTKFKKLTIYIPAEIDEWVEAEVANSDLKSADIYRRLLRAGWKAIKEVSNAGRADSAAK